MLRFCETKNRRKERRTSSWAQMYSYAFLVTYRGVRTTIAELGAVVMSAGTA